MAVTATPPTGNLLTEASMAMPWVMPVTAPLCSRLLRRAAGRRTANRVSEVELERVAIQLGRGREVRETGAKDSRPAQRHDRQYRAEKGAAHRNGGPAAPSLQGVADTDHGARPSTRRCQMTRQH